MTAALSTVASALSGLPEHPMKGASNNKNETAIKLSLFAFSHQEPQHGARSRSRLYLAEYSSLFR